MLFAAKSRILQELGIQKAAWTVNICVPTSTFRDDLVILTYEVVLHEANRISDALIANPGNDEFNLEKINAALDACILPPRENKMTFVVSEALAEVMAYVHSSAVQPDKHVLVDVGAGTTDVSFFYPNMRERKIWWYGTGTLPVAGDAVDDALVSALRRKYPEFDEMNGVELAERTRKAKEKWAEDTALVLDIGHREYRLTWGEAISAANAVFDRIMDGYRKIWGHAYDRDRGTNRWADVKVIIGGGSSYLPRIHRLFCRSVYDLIPNWQEEYFPVPNDLDWGDLVPGDFHRLAVAYGLSTPFPALPGEGFPSPMDSPNPPQQYMPRRPGLLDSGLQRCVA